MRHTGTRKTRKPSLLRVTAYLSAVKTVVDIVTALFHAVKDALR